MTAQLATRAERLDLVRRALVRAETATGVRHVDWAAAAPPSASPGESVASGARSPGDQRAARREPDAAPSGDRTVPARFDGGWLAVPPVLRGVVPHGAVRRGSSLSVLGSTTLLLHVVASLAEHGGWTAVVGHPDLGLAAALDAGLDPARLVLVPDPGPSAPEVIGAVVDGFDVVVVGRAALGDRDRRAIGQRVRHRGAVLVSTLPWPGAEVSLEAGESAWYGLATGRLTEAQIVVRATGRAGGAPRSVVLRVREHDGGTRLLPDVTSVGTEVGTEVAGNGAGAGVVALVASTGSAELERMAG